MSALLGARLGDPHVPYPVAAVDLDVVRHNVAEMDRYCEQRSVLIAPHVKTTMVPDVLEMQIKRPTTWGLSVANGTQGRLADEVGAQRILVANQLIERDDIGWAADLAKAGRSVMSLVDTIDGVRWLDLTLAEINKQRGSPSPQHPVLLEVGYPGGRCGTRTWDDVDAVADAVNASHHLVLRGVAGFEGMGVGGAGSPDDIDLVTEYLSRLSSTAIRLADRWDVSGSEAILSAGGSAFFDLVVDICHPAARQTGGLLLLRSGCYAIHDHGIYARTFPGTRTQRYPDLQPAATVWVRVQSRPDRRRVVAAAGKRDLPSDAGLPTPLGIRYRNGLPDPLAPGSLSVMLSDHHLHLDVPDESDLTVGDVLVLGISHPCALFDRWRCLAVVDDQRRVVGTVRPRF